jgi:transcriptional regulator with XRE-family HTH domain
LTLASIFTLFVTMSTATKPNHIGYKIGRIRELRGLKQEFVAHELNVSQQTISRIEQSETVDEQMLEQIASILGVSAEGIKNFSEEAVFNIISNTFNNTSNDTSTLIASSLNYQPTFNTIEKIVELYERLLQSEREKVELLQAKKDQR